MMTPDFLFRVYHSRDVAFKFQITGERNFRNLLLTDMVYGGFMPQETNAALVFGYDFDAARLVIEHHLNGLSSRIPMYSKRNTGNKVAALSSKTTGERLTPVNLGNPLYYLPLQKSAMPLLQLFQFPGWVKTLNRVINQQAFGLYDQTRWCYEQDGRMIYLLADLNLQHIDMAFRQIKNNPDKQVGLACFEWQVPLFWDLLQPFKTQDIVVKRISDGLVCEVIGMIDWG